MTEKHKKIIIYTSVLTATAAIAAGVTMSWFVYSLLHWKVKLGDHTWHIHSRVDHAENK